MTGAAGLPVRLSARALRPSLAIALLAILPMADPLRGQWVERYPWRDPDTLPAVDVLTRYEAFERDFDREFRHGARDETVTRLEAYGERARARLLERFEGTAILSWYQVAERLYERLSERVEGWTSWTAGGFELAMDVESVAEGTGRVHLERSVHGFRLGLDLNDVAEGTVGLRIGGDLMGYRVHLYAGDVVDGRWRFGVRWRGWGLGGE